MLVFSGVLCTHAYIYKQKYIRKKYDNKIQHLQKQQTTQDKLTTMINVQTVKIPLKLSYRLRVI